MAQRGYDGARSWEWSGVRHQDEVLERLTVGRFGVVEVEERLAGPGVTAAFGEDEHVTRLSFSPDDAARLAAVLGVDGADGPDGLWTAIVGLPDGAFDLMDKADEAGIPYVYTAGGDATGMVYRPPRC